LVNNHFSCIELDQNQLLYVSLLDQQPITACPRCGRSLPTIGWAGHERQLIDAGFTPLVGQPQPFEIPGMGLGFFSMRRDQWVGFNEHARGFGGEELYVHEKVRRKGGKVLCPPEVKWCHRFGRPGGVPYPINRYGKTRNYVLEFQELDLPLDPIRAHFVDSGLLSEREWKYLLVNPFEHVTPPGGSGGCGGKPAGNSAASQANQPPAGAQTLDTLATAIGTRQATVTNLANTVTMAASFATMAPSGVFTAEALANAPSGGLSEEEVANIVTEAITAVIADTFGE
jgi:hypothetical protein